jgi:hypothetical protein
MGQAGCCSCKQTAQDSFCPIACRCQRWSCSMCMRQLPLWHDYEACLSPSCNHYMMLPQIKLARATAPHSNCILLKQLYSASPLLLYSMVERSFARLLSSCCRCCCCCRVFLYEKTLPGLGGRSLIDGGLADSGATLAHEIGHQLVSGLQLQF